MPEIFLDKKTNIQIWDGAAATYGHVGPDFYDKCGGHLVDLLNIRSGMNVLDIATGTGAVLIPASQKVGGQGRVTGIDLAGEMIQATQRATRALGLQNVALLKMDAEHLEFPDASFDVITCGFGVFFCPDMGAAFREMFRVCKAGGFIGLTVFDKHPAPFTPGFAFFGEQCLSYKGPTARTPNGIAWTPEEMKNLLEQYGFRTALVQSELHDLVYQNPEEWWNFLLTLGHRAVIFAMDETTRSRFKQEYCARLQTIMKPDGLHMTTAVVYAIGQR